MSLARYVYISTLQERLRTGVLMVPRAISVGGTGGKVCRPAKSVQLVLQRAAVPRQADG